MKNKTILPALGLAVSSLFMANKTFAQAERKEISFNRFTEVHSPAVLPKNVKIVSARSLDTAAHGANSMCQCASISMINDTVIVETDRAMQMVKSEPEMIKQINTVRNLTKDVPKNSIIEFHASAEAGGYPDVTVGIYTQQNTDATAYFHGTPAENLKKLHYDMRLFKLEMKANNLEKNPGKKNYTVEETMDITNRAERDMKSPGVDFKYQ